jgi:hypothetical protein
VFGLAAIAGAYAAGRLAHMIAPGVLTAFDLTMFAAAFALTALTAQSLRQREVRPQDLPLGEALVAGLIVARSSRRWARAADSWSYRR